MHVTCIFKGKTKPASCGLCFYLAFTFLNWSHGETFATGIDFAKLWPTFQPLLSWAACASARCAVRSFFGVWFVFMVYYTMLLPCQTRIFVPQNKYPAGHIPQYSSVRASISHHLRSTSHPILDWAGDVVQYAYTSRLNNCEMSRLNNCEASQYMRNLYRISYLIPHKPHCQCQNCHNRHNHDKFKNLINHNHSPSILESHITIIIGIAANVNTPTVQTNSNILIPLSCPTYCTKYTHPHRMCMYQRKHRYRTHHKGYDGKTEGWLFVPCDDYIVVTPRCNNYFRVYSLK